MRGVLSGLMMAGATLAAGCRGAATPSNDQSDFPDCETVLEPGPAETEPAWLGFRTTMGSHYRLDGLCIAVDRRSLLTLAQQRAVVDQGLGAFFDWQGRLAKGAHTLTVQLSFSGRGPALGYRFVVKSKRAITVEPCVRTNVVAYEQEGRLEERPAIRYEVRPIAGCAP